VKSLVAVTTLFLLMVLCGCGTSLPTEHDARQALQDNLPESGEMKLAALHKTNGKGGEQSYTVEFDAEVEFTADSWWNGRYLKNTPSSTRSVKEPGPTVEFHVSLDHGKPAPAPPPPAPTVKAGQRVEVEGEMDLEKTEKGWRATYVSFKRSQPQTTGTVGR
jgi:hypothetical protein